MSLLRRIFLGIAVGGFVLLPVLTQVVTAATNSPKDTFSILVSPSPLVASIKPGTSTTLELKIRNSGTGDEKLKVELKDFKVDSSSNVKLLDSSPQQVEKWVSFSAPTFTVRSGEWYTQKISLNAPKDAAFSYTFAVAISRVQQLQATPGTAGYQGTVAVLALINVDRPGATREFSIEKFETDKRVYEYLPAKFSFVLKNTGNSIVQPQGNIFIQRSSNSKPLAVLKLNPKDSYILSNSGRTLTNNWADGFPSYQSQQSADNTPAKDKLVWDWGQAQHFRFGHYVAKMVAIYNDGQRDIPIEAEIGFWVIPWKLMLGVTLTLVILVVGLIVIARRLLKLTRYARGYHHKD